MGVVAPVSGVGAAVIPVVVAVLLGERPEALSGLGSPWRSVIRRARCERDVETYMAGLARPYCGVGL